MYLWIICMFVIYEAEDFVPIMSIVAKVPDPHKMGVDLPITHTDGGCSRSGGPDHW